MKKYVTPEMEIEEIKNDVILDSQGEPQPSDEPPVLK